MAIPTSIFNIHEGKINITNGHIKTIVGGWSCFLTSLSMVVMSAQMVNKVECTSLYNAKKNSPPRVCSVDNLPWCLRRIYKKKTNGGSKREADNNDKKLLWVWDSFHFCLIIGHPRDCIYAKYLWPMQNVLKAYDVLITIIITNLYMV